MKPIEALIIKVTGCKLITLLKVNSTTDGLPRIFLSVQNSFLISSWRGFCQSFEDGILVKCFIFGISVKKWNIVKKLCWTPVFKRIIQILLGLMRGHSKAGHVKSNIFALSLSMSHSNRTKGICHSPKKASSLVKETKGSTKN